VGRWIAPTGRDVERALGVSRLVPTIVEGFKNLIGLWPDEARIPSVSLSSVRAA